VLKVGERCAVFMLLKAGTCRSTKWQYILTCHMCSILYMSKWYCSSVNILLSISVFAYCVAYMTGVYITSAMFDKEDT